MRRRLPDLREQSGISLVMAIGVLMVLSISSMTVVSYTNSNARSAAFSGATASAYDLAEAGINEMAAILHNPANDALNPTLLPSTTRSYDSGSVTWSGVLTQSVNGASTWTITSTGKLPNPTGATKQVTRKLTAKVPVVPVYTQPLNNPAWNYIVARATGGTCDMTISNSVVIASPLYVAGNLCLQNQAAISTGPLTVQGSLTMSQSQNYVGTQSVPLNSVAVRNGCKWTNNALHNPCQQGAGSQGKDNLWANSITNQPSSVTFPVPDWDGWYLNSRPGPYHPCLETTGIPPSFDNDQGSTPNVAKRNNSLTTVQNLTPTNSYSCKTEAGELSWNAITRVLTTNGVVFIDGSAKIDNGQVNTFRGEGALYFSGTLLIKNSKLCAVVTGSGNNQTCTTTGWDPSVNNVVFVANGTGSAPAPQNQVASGDGIQLVSAYAQGAAYATNAIDIGTTSQFDGPLDGSTVILGQSTSTSWPGFSFVPIGMPGNPTVFAQPQPPQLYSG